MIERQQLFIKPKLRGKDYDVYNYENLFVRITVRLKWRETNYNNKFTRLFPPKPAEQLQVMYHDDTVDFRDHFWLSRLSWKTFLLHTLKVQLRKNVRLSQNVVFIHVLPLITA